DRRVRCNGRYCLKNQLQGQLQNARIPRRRDAPERGRGKARTRAAEIHIVKGIEEFRAELGIEALGDFRVLEQPQVSVEQARPAENALAFIAEGSHRIATKQGSIKVTCDELPMRTAGV